MKHTVYDYGVVRWLEKHHNNKKISLQNAKGKNATQLREIFDSLDEDKSGTIEICELSTAMESLGYYVDRQFILQQFNYVDSDGSGSIDFDEFLTVMTSDALDQHFFQLSDEIEVRTNDMQFFHFATAYRRKKLIDTLSKAKRDSDVYNLFDGLFSAPNIPSGVLTTYTSSYESFKNRYERTRKELVSPELKQNTIKAARRSQEAAADLRESDADRGKYPSLRPDRSVRREMKSNLQARKEARAATGRNSFLKQHCYARGLTSEYKA